MPTVIRYARTAAFAGLAVFFTGLIVWGVAQTASADEESFPPVKDPVVAKECRACHMLYQPGLMPAASWTRIMAGLKDHFGENAEVDAQTTEHVLAYLTANAAKPLANQRGAAPAGVTAEAPLRITELPWFVRKHHRKNRISPVALARNNAKSPADCVACHKQAEAGEYGD